MNAPVPKSDVVASLAVTLDGYIASSDGGVDYLEKYPIEDFDFDAWVAQIGALIMGSVTYEQTVGWGWAWGDMPTMVLTSRSGLPVPDGAAVRFANKPTAEAIRSFSAETDKRLWVFGGGKVVTEGLAGGAINVLDVVVMPEALGEGVPLFTESFVRPMKLTEAIPYNNGAVRLVYDIEN